MSSEEKKCLLALLFYICLEIILINTETSLTMDADRKDLVKVIIYKR